MSPSYFCRNLVYLLSESKVRLKFLQKLFVPFKRIPETALQLGHKVYYKFYMNIV